MLSKKNIDMNEIIILFESVEENSRILFDVLTRIVEEENI